MSAGASAPSVRGPSGRVVSEAGQILERFQPYIHEFDIISEDP